MSAASGDNGKCGTIVIPHFGQPFFKSLMCATIKQFSQAYQSLELDVCCVVGNADSVSGRFATGIFSSPLFEFCDA